MTNEELNTIRAAVYFEQERWKRLAEGWHIDVVRFVRKRPPIVRYEYEELKK